MKYMKQVRQFLTNAIYTSTLYNYIYMCFCALMKITFYNTIYVFGVWGRKLGGGERYMLIWRMCVHLTSIICIKKKYTLYGAWENLLIIKYVEFIFMPFAKHSSPIPPVFRTNIHSVPSLWIYVWLNISCMQFVNWRNNKIPERYNKLLLPT